MPSGRRVLSQEELDALNDRGKCESKGGVWHRVGGDDRIRKSPYCSNKGKNIELTLEQLEEKIRTNQVRPEQVFMRKKLGREKSRTGKVYTKRINRDWQESKHADELRRLFAAELARLGAGQPSRPLTTPTIPLPRNAPAIRPPPATVVPTEKGTGKVFPRSVTFASTEPVTTVSKGGAPTVLPKGTSAGSVTSKHPITFAAPTLGGGTSTPSSFASAATTLAGGASTPRGTYDDDDDDEYDGSRYWY